MSVMAAEAAAPAVESAVPAAAAPAAAAPAAAPAAGPAAAAPKSAGPRPPAPKSGAPKPSGGPKGKGPAPARRAGGSKKKGGKGPSGKAFDSLRKPIAGAPSLLMAEFMLCFGLIAINPVFTRKPAGGHLYKANDFVRLSAVSLLFFVLALGSNNRRMSSITALFGGLVTLGLAYNSAPTFAALGSIFTNSQAANATGAALTGAAAGTAKYDTASYTPAGLSGDPSANAGSPETSAPAGTGKSSPPTQSSSGGGGPVPV